MESILVKMAENVCESDSWSRRLANLCDISHDDVRELRMIYNRQTRRQLEKDNIFGGLIYTQHRTFVLLVPSVDNVYELKLFVQALFVLLVKLLSFVRQF